MRTFISIEPPENIKQKLAKLKENLKSAKIKFVEKENLHICVKFLGETTEHKIDQIKEALKRYRLIF